jgi:multimeric flavodoxin WrbA
MKVVGVSCSARVNKNTADLLSLALEVLNKKGLETELIQLANYKILPCQGCDYQCLYHKQKDCPIKDDVPKVWKKLLSFDALIYGVPVYSGTIPSLLKILFERSQALNLERNPKKPQIVGIIILGTYGHLNVLGALAPSIIYYPMSKPVGYALAIGWEKAVEREQTRREVIALAENVYKESTFQTGRNNT